MASYETIEVKRDGAVVRLTINRPQVLNALNAQVIKEMTEAITALDNHPDVRALVIGSAGDKAFVAGADIAAMAEMKPAEALDFARKGQALTTLIESRPYVTIGRVQGFALGGGCELAMACDILVATKTAKFGQPEVDLGLIPGFGGTQRLIRRVGPTLALDMLVGGRKLSGEEALSYGLVARVTEPEDLDGEINKVLKGVLRAGPHAVRETKRLARAAMAMPLEHGLASEATAFAACFGDVEAGEGLSAFLQKRKANFAQ